jgi:uncharacterized membrane protein YkvA (DUF1232 family)
LEDYSRAAGTIAEMDRSIAHVVEGFRDLAHIPTMGRLFLSLFTDRRVPLWLKLCAGAGAIYVVSPFDIIPDSITGIGYLDDIIMVVLLLQTFIEMSPDDVVQEHCAKLGIDPRDLHVDITHSVTNSIAAVLPFLEKGGSNGTGNAATGGKPTVSANAARYSSYDDDGQEDGTSPAQTTLSESQRQGRYSAYSPTQG